MAEKSKKDETFEDAVEVIEPDTTEEDRLREEDLDSDESQDYRDAIEEAMANLELEDPNAEFKGAFNSLEEAKQEIERAGEEFRLREDNERQNSSEKQGDEDGFQEFEEALQRDAQRMDKDDEAQEKAQKRLDEVEEEREARKMREENMSDEEKQSLKDQSEALKKDGNSLFKEKQFEEALSLYTKAMELCPLNFEKEHSVYFANRAAAKYYMGSLDSALEDCHSSLQLNPDYVKVLARRGLIYEEQNKPHEAMADFKRILELDANHAEAKNAVRRLPEKIAQRDEEIKQEMFGNLKKLGNMVLNPFGLSTDNFQFVKDEETGSYSVNFKQNQS